MTSKIDKPSQTAGTDGYKKRPYVKPSTRHETVFEVMALACGKISGTSSNCNSARKTS